MRTALIALALAAALLAACGGSSAKLTPTALPSVTTTASRASPNSTATPAATPTPGPPRVQVTGLFSGAPPAGSQPVATTRTLGPEPASVFAPWDGTQGVIYDTKTGKEIDLGPAAGITFNPDSKFAAWIADPLTASVTVLDLSTGERRNLEAGRAVAFLSDGRLAITRADGTEVAYDAASGTLSANQTMPRDAFGATWPTEPAGFHWEISADTTTALTRGWFGRNTFRLIDNQSNATALQFDAVSAAAAGPGEVVVATPLDGVMTNIFIVNIASGKAEFVARARYGRGPNWPLSATGRYVLWTENYCHLQDVDPPQGQMQLYDRESKTLTDIADGVPVNSLQEEGLRYGVLTPNNSVGIGAAIAEFGATALFDPATLTWSTVLPSFAAAKQAHQTAWSPDFRYASYTLGGGRGGYC